MDRHGTILIADDEPSCREVLQEILEPAGFPVCTAGDGTEVLDILGQRQIDLLVCDMHMPQLNGLETFTLARRIHALIQCVLVTASSDAQLVRKALECQIHSVLAKPVNRAELIFTVQRAIRRSTQQ